MRNPHKQENRPTSARAMARCIATAPKTAEERLYTLARGWLAYPVTPGAHIATAEVRLYMLARGWLAYPVTSTHHPSTAEERLYKRHPGMRQRRITPRNPIRTTRQRRAHGASAGHHLYALRRCAPTPTAQAVTPSVNPRPRRGYTHRRICAAERRR